MPKLIPKYQSPGVITGGSSGYAKLQQDIATQGFAFTASNPAPLPPEVASMQTSTPTYAPPDLEVALEDVISNSENPGSTSAIGGLLSTHKRNNPFGFKTGSESTSATGGFNLKNQAMGMAANYLGQAIGQQVGGKYGDEIGQLGSVIGQNLLTNGNLKGLFTGGSGAALGGIGYNVLNKAMGGDKNKDFGSKMLTNLGGMAFAINPVLGAAVTGVMVANNLTGKSTQKYEGNSFQSQEMQADLGGSYGSSMIDLERARNKAGHYGGIARLTGEYNRARNRVQTGNDTLTAMQQIYDNKQLGKIRGQNMADINSLDYRLNTFGGYDQYGTVIGRKGMKLPTINDINKVRDLLKFKKGGQMNVIPEGALHARLHHMETENKITRKGIPVIDKNGEQQAEIERNEIIFSLEVTNKLEELRKDGSDKAALEAGKLLVDEIFHNTDDRTGLIQEVIGTDEAKKGVFKEGGIIAEKPNFAIQAEEPEMDSDEDEPVGIEEVEYFQTGGIIAEEPDGSDNEEVEEYQEGKKVKFIYDQSPRTEGNVIYYNTPESKIHEYYGHYSPNKELLKELEAYYSNLNDEKLRQFGANLDFVKRDDPNNFYQPEELLGRLYAARYMLGNQKVDSNFFENLLNTNPNKYGDNLRDLLMMYNPKYLNEMFSILDKYPMITKHWEKPSNWTDEKIPYSEWIKGVNPEYMDDNYDLESAYNSDTYSKQDLEKWKWSTNQDLPEIYMNYQDDNGKYSYHLGSIAELDNGDYIFLKKGKEDTNPELHFETDSYRSGENGLINTHDLKYEGDRYYYRKKNTSKKENGGIIEQLSKLSPDKLKELEKILKYLSHD